MLIFAAALFSDQTYLTFLRIFFSQCLDHSAGKLLQEIHVQHSTARKMHWIHWIGLASHRGASCIIENSGSGIAYTIEYCNFSFLSRCSNVRRIKGTKEDYFRRHHRMQCGVSSLYIGRNWCISLCNFPSWRAWYALWVAPEIPRDRHKFTWKLNFET